MSVDDRSQRDLMKRFDNLDIDLHCELARISFLGNATAGLIVPEGPHLTDSQGVPKPLGV